MQISFQDSVATFLGKVKAKGFLFSDTSVAPRIFASRSDAEAATVHADAETIDVIHDGLLLRYVKDASGTALTTSGSVNWSPAGPHYTFQHWGAVGDDATDSTSAISSALSFGGGFVARVEDKFFCTTITETLANDTFIDGGTYRFNSVSDGGFDITLSGRTRFGFKNARILQSAEQITSSAFYGLKIEQDDVVARDNKWEKFIYLDNLEIGGVEKSDGWIRGLGLVNTTDPEIGELFIRGRVDSSISAGTGLRYWRAESVAIAILSSGVGNPVAIKMDGVSIRNFEYGIYAVASMEGLFFDKGKIVNCRFGVHADWDGGGSDINPLLSITNTHINCREKNVYTKNIYEGMIKNNLLYCFDLASSETETWYGVDAETMNQSMITGNTFSGIPGGGSVSFDRIPISLRSSSKRTLVADNYGYNLSQGIDCGDSIGAAYNKHRIRDNEWYRGASTAPHDQVETNASSCRIATSW